MHTFRTSTPVENIETLEALIEKGNRCNQLWECASNEISTANSQAAVCAFTQEAKSIHTSLIKLYIAEYACRERIREEKFWKIGTCPHLELRDGSGKRWSDGGGRDAFIGGPRQSGIEPDANAGSCSGIDGDGCRSGRSVTGVIGNGKRNGSAAQIEKDGAFFRGAYSTAVDSPDVGDDAAGSAGAGVEIMGMGEFTGKCDSCARILEQISDCVGAAGHGVCAMVEAIVEVGLGEGDHDEGEEERDADGELEGGRWRRRHDEGNAAGARRDRSGCIGS